MNEWDDATESDEEELQRILSAKDVAAENQRRQSRRDRLQKEHNDRAMLRVTFASTVVAVIAALAALWSGWEAQRTRIEDERPLISVSEFSDETLTHQTNEDGADPNQPYLFVSGKTPALSVQVECERVELGRIETYAEMKSHLRPVDINRFEYILPGHSERFNCSDIPLELKPDALSDVVGVVTYHDRTLHVYRTPFCISNEVVTYAGGKVAFFTQHCGEGKRYDLPRIE